MTVESSGVGQMNKLNELARVKDEKAENTYNLLLAGNAGGLIATLSFIGAFIGSGSREPLSELMFFSFLSFGTGLLLMGGLHYVALYEAIRIYADNLNYTLAAEEYKHVFIDSFLALKRKLKWRNLILALAILAFILGSVFLTVQVYFLTAKSG